MDRRGIFKGAGSMLGVLALAPAPARGMNNDNCVRVAKQKTFVLVHGAWVSSWTFADLDRRLTQRGHRVFRPTLTGWGARSHLAAPTVGVSTNVADVSSLIEFEQLQDVVLVGHSYGGMVVTAVADAMPERIAAIVYLDAFLPQGGKSLADYAGNGWRAICDDLKAKDEFLLPLTIETSNGPLTIEPAPPRITPVPVETQLEVVELTGAFQTVASKTYIRAASGSASYFEQFYEFAKNDPGWSALKVQSGHMIYEELPERTVQILEEA